MSKPKQLPGGMSIERWEQLMYGPEPQLTPQEMDAGWFFCCEWDFLLIHKDDYEARCCTCKSKKSNFN